jgi:ribonuclease BN (tRNA processing enzyme)
MMSGVAQVRRDAMKLTIVGCGDAFGSGGRLQTCYHVQCGASRFLIDCGATALIGLSRLKIDPNSIDTVVLSHLHGDHYAGLVWWLVYAQHVGKRSTPLTVVGPAGVEARLTAAAEALFPGAMSQPRRYRLSFAELSPAQPTVMAGLSVTPFEVNHPSGAPSYALRFQLGGKVLAFSGDTEWVDGLFAVGAGADLYITECYQFDGEPRYHMSWKGIEPKLQRMAPKRVMLTHMGEAMLARRAEVDYPGVVLAEDGLVLDL